MRLFSCWNVNNVDPANVVSYRGEIVRCAYEDEGAIRPGCILSAEQHIVLIDTLLPSGQQELLPNLYPGSPDGFSWGHGYGGSGPSALALSLLAHHLGEHPCKDAPYGGLPMADLMSADLVRSYISRWSIDKGWVLPVDQVRGWVQRWQRAHAARLVRRAEDVAHDLAFEREMDALVREGRG